MDIKALLIPEKKAEQFKAKKIFTVEDLLERFPIRYINGLEAVPFNKISDGQTCRAEGTVTSVIVGQKDVINVNVHDDTGAYLRITFFHMPFVADQICRGCKITVVGKFKTEIYKDKKNVSIVNPKRYVINSTSLNRIIPVYRKVRGMSEDYYESCVLKALNLVHYDEFLSGEMLVEKNLCTRDCAYRYIHIPASTEELKAGRRRFLFNDLFLFNLMLRDKKDRMNPASPFRFTGAKLMTDYFNTLKFGLTEGQKNAVQFLYKTGKAGKRVSALLQADVGYGKTECAKMFALFGVEAGCQAVIVAPTTVLAQQHFHDFSKSFDPIGVTVGYLSSELTQRERKKVLAGIKDGSIQVIVGTHSCLSDSVVYHNLGLVVVDEEHRFGVRQREKLALTAEQGVHCLSMSATPIPRTLAMAMYGEGIDVIDIKTAPAFKKDIITKLVESDEELINALLPELQAGHQAYVVCPMIDENDDSDIEIADVKSVCETYQKLLAPYGYHVEMLNGKMKKTDIASVISDFSENKTQVLVSTTVVEVGVNVPNSTIMIVRNAERFGLAQLHQLRGRVGRGEAQGYCFLQSVDEKARERLEVLVNSNDGFYIAQQDLLLRGAGNFAGTEQSGDNKFFDEMLKYPKFNQSVRQMVNDIYADEQMKEYFTDYFHEFLEEDQES